VSNVAVTHQLNNIIKRLRLGIEPGQTRVQAVAAAGAAFLRREADEIAAKGASGAGGAKAKAATAPGRDATMTAPAPAQDPDLNSSASEPEPVQIAGLSVPQFQIFKLIGQGLSINEIATTRRQDLAAVKDRVDKLRRVFKFKTLDELVGAARSWRARMDKGAAPLYIRGLLVPATHTATELYIEKDLSPIQFAVLRELGAGKNPADIAARRHLSVKSVMHSIKVLHDRLKLKGRTGQTKSEVVAAAGAVFLAQEANEIAVMKAPVVKPTQPAPIPAGDLMQQGARS
jgi:DNA-binding NarL/FixJ family response regulator